MQLVPDADAVTRWQAARSQLRSAERASAAARLAEIADRARRQIVEVISSAGLGHVGGDLSVIDLLTCLYFAVANVDPLSPSWPARDRVILSKGHAAVSHYVTLANCGYFSREVLASFARPGSPLGGHAHSAKVPGVEASTGPLGHGLPIGVGAALAASLTGAAWRVFVVVGDGELQEGSNWEAAMYAAQRRLSNLVVVIDRNRLQQGAGTEETNGLEPLAERFTAFGWQVRAIDGHDHGAIVAALEGACGTGAGAAPRAVIARTTKGRGVSFMEGLPEWHHKVPSPGQRALALRELRR